MFRIYLESLSVTPFSVTPFSQDLLLTFFDSWMKLRFNEHLQVVQPFLREISCFAQNGVNEPFLGPKMVKNH